MLILLSSANRGKCVNLCGVLWQILQLFSVSNVNCRFQWPRGLRRRSAATHLLRLWVRIPPGAWMCICCECCVLSGRGLCDKLITRPEESYRMCCVVVCALETSRIGAPYIYDIGSLRVNLGLCLSGTVELLIYNKPSLNCIVWSSHSVSWWFQFPAVGYYDLLVGN